MEAEKQELSLELRFLIEVSVELEESLLELPREGRRREFSVPRWCFMHDVSF